MDRLGDDELSLVFKKLRKRSDRKSFCQVSKKFLRVACHLQRTLSISFPHLHFLMLRASQNLLNFNCFKPLSNSHMKLLAISCPRLLKLDLTLVPGFESFEYDFDNDGFSQVVNACRHLIEVNLSRRLFIGDVGIISLVTSCRNLRSLNFSGCVRVTDQSLRAIGGLTSLKSLNLKCCYLVTDLGLKYLATGNVRNCLSDLDLSECDRIRDNGIVYLKEMVNLEGLNLSNCGINVTDSGVKILVSRLQNVEFLDFSWLVNLTDISLCVIASKCLKLTTICLTGCQAISGEGVRAFAHHSTLRELNLLACHNLSWQDVLFVASTCSQLTYLSLSYNIKMSMADDYVYKINNCQIDWE